MRLIIRPGIVAGLSLVLALSAVGQTSSAPANNSQSLPTPAARTPTNNDYTYEFIAKRFVWSNKPLNSTATKICKVMKNRSFNETAYAVNGQQDWNACLQTQIRSIGYLRWLKNDGFKPNSKNRKSAQAYLKKSYPLGGWGGYTFTQLSEAVRQTSDPGFPVH